MAKNIGKKIGWALGCIAVLLVAIVIGGSLYMVSYALTPAEYSQQFEVDRHVGAYPWQTEWVDSIFDNKVLKDTTILSDKGEKMHAFYISAPDTTTKTVVLVHGYKDCAIRMLRYAYFYNKDFRFNVLIPDLHAHGESEGDAIQMGWKDRLDVIRWIGIADTLFNSGHDIVVHGLSMGAATTMMVSGEESVQDIVKVFVEDCGYTSVWDEFKGELKNQFGLPAFPILHVASIICDIRYGWNFKEASALEQVKKCTRPMLFIHGDADDFVPTDFVYPLHEAHHGPKDLWLTAGTAHAEAYKDYPDEYVTKVKTFLDKYMK